MRLDIHVDHAALIVRQHEQVLSLDPSGSLVVTTTRSGLGGAPPSTSATTYKKNP
jgi:hypothetical protein